MKLKIDEGEGFLSKKAGSFSGVPQRTVQSWTEKSLIIAEKADTTGTGKRRRYSILNCIEIAIIKSLTDERLSLKVIKSAMRLLRNKSNLKTLLSEDEGYLILQIGTDHVIVAPQYSIFGFSKQEKVDIKRWYQFTRPKACDKTIIININKIAQGVLKNIG